MRSAVPSLSRRRRTRVGSPDLGSSSITFDAASGAGSSMMPLSSFGVAARLCFFTMFTPSTTTRNSLGWTCSTLPSFPRCSPEITRTVSPLAICILWRSGSRGPVLRRLFLKTSGFMSNHLGRERHDFHEPLLAQLPPHGSEDAGRAGLPLIGNQHRGVFVEPDVGAVLALGLLGRPHDHRSHHLALLDLASGNRVLDRDHDDVAQARVASLGESAGERDGAVVLHPLAHHHARATLAPPPHAPFVSARMVLMRAISRRMPRSWSGFSIASVARRNPRRNRSSVSTASCCSSSSFFISRRASGFLRAILALLPLHELRLDGQLGRRQIERLARQIFGDALELEHHAPGLHHGDPSLGVPLALAHPRLRRLLGDRLVGEQPDPHLAAALHLARQRYARRLDLPVGDPPGLERHETVMPERDGIAARGHAFGAALEPLAELDALRCQHAVRPPSSTSGPTALRSSRA